MIGARFTSCHMVDVSGICAGCSKPVTKKVPAHIARRTKDLVHDSYECKRQLSIRKGKERYARGKARA